MAIINSRFLIFTDCGSQIGFGHLNRCNSIKVELEQNNIEVCTKIYDDRGVSEVKFDWKDEWLALIETYKPTHVLIDSFRVSECFFKGLIKLKLSIFVIDDFPERNHQGGTVINWTVGADVESFLPRNSKVNYLLGAQYCCIRSEFYEKPYIKDHDKNSVLVTFGGADVRQLSSSVIKHLSSNHPSLTINLVLGSGAEKKDYSSFKKVKVHHNCDAKKMCQLMDNVEFAICGGGQTLYEMASRGLPPIIIPLIDNQLADIKGFVSRGFGLEALSWNDPNLFASLDIAINEIQNFQRRNTQAGVGVALIDGGGLKRLVSALLKVPIK